MDGFQHASWQDLDAGEREALLELGWTQVAFDNNEGPPDNPWLDLSARQKNLAMMFGCDSVAWDALVEDEIQAKKDRVVRAENVANSRSATVTALTDIDSLFGELTEQVAEAIAEVREDESRKVRENHFGAQARALGLLSFSEIMSNAAARSAEDANRPSAVVWGNSHTRWRGTTVEESGPRLSAMTLNPSGKLVRPCLAFACVCIC
jgi:hypothetical protein